MSLLSSLLTRSDVRQNPPSERNRDLFLRCYALFSTLSCGIGAVILTGGPDRFSEPMFVGPISLVQWLPIFAPHAIWGLMFVGHGMTTILSMRRPLAIHALRFGMFIYALLAVMFAWSCVQEPTAAALGVVVFIGFAGLALLLQDHLSEYGWEG